MEKIITKLNENEVEIASVEREVLSYETLIAQKNGILSQQKSEHDALEQRDAERAIVLADIENSLKTGIAAKAIEDKLEEEATK